MTYPAWQKQIREAQSTIASQDAEHEAQRKSKRQQEKTAQLRKALEDTGIGNIVTSPHVVDGYSFYIERDQDFYGELAGAYRLCISRNVPDTPNHYPHLSDYKTQIHHTVYLNGGKAHTAMIATAIDLLDEDVTKQSEINKQAIAKHNEPAYTFSGDSIADVLAQVISELVDENHVLPFSG